MPLFTVRLHQTVAYDVHDVEADSPEAAIASVEHTLVEEGCGIDDLTKYNEVTGEEYSAWPAPQVSQ
jgi:hypothetical protein